MGKGRRWRPLRPHRHHTDAEREWAYDRNSSIGKLDNAREAAQAMGWTVVDMKNDWKKIFPFGSKMTSSDQINALPQALTSRRH